MAKENNPFVLPGFGQQGEAAQNPLFAGLEMMNQAWQGLAKGSTVSATPTMSIEDLDKKISELQTVHNWLQLNSTMLANTIQGLEIQRSTLSMVKSFAASASSDKNEDEKATNSEYAQAASEWWNLLQQQFEQMTEATTASLQSMANAAEETKPAKASKTSKASKPATKKAAKPAASKTAAKKTRKT